MSSATSDRPSHMGGKTNMMRMNMTDFEKSLLEVPWLTRPISVDSMTRASPP